jgi:Tol biopolymer transport system component/predicted Ser/Thr protein kinase
MTPERWQKIEQLYHAALERDVSLRPAYLHKVCASDDALRREVESLLAQDSSAQGFLEKPVVEAAGKILADQRQSSLLGRQLGSYKILSVLGAGGMGEVYKALDTRLERTVAIKVLPAHLAGRAESRERFEREAKTIANLNHPHICTLYDTGHQDDVDFLVMEYVEGETLAQRLEKGPLPIQQVLQYAVEIADALDKAHRKGVIHRDLKPGNIMLTKSGTKLLDFGLAKLGQSAVPATPESQLPTMKDGITGEGTILGTLQYMAPEQIEAKKVDARTDIFAFGAVVYEMTTGKRAFEGKSSASVMAKILEAEPPGMTSLQPMTPLQLDRVVRTCLAKDPDERWQAAGDLCRELKWIAEAKDTGLAAAPAPGTAQQRWWQKHAWVTGLAAVAIVAILALAVIVVTAILRGPPGPPSQVMDILRGSAPETRAIRFTVGPPEKQHFPAHANTTSFLSVSPDGTKLALVAIDSAGHPTLWLRDLDSQTAWQLPGTDDAAAPFWSPDSRFIAFTDRGSLKKIDITGGPPQVIVGSPAIGGGTWSQDGVILFSTATFGGPILRVPAAGGTATSITPPDTPGHQIGYAWPKFLPDGRHFLYFARSGDPGSGAIYVGSLDSKETKRLLNSNSMAEYSQPGYLLFVRAGTLLEQPFDANRLEVKGEAFPIAESVLFSIVNGRAAIAASANGVLAYRTAPSEGHLRLVFTDRKGAEQPLAAPPHAYRNPRLSPDGQRIAVTIDEGGSQEWLLDIARGTLSRLSFEGNYNGGTAWTPDGKRITFGSDRAGTRNLFWQLADGSGNADRLMSANTIQVAGFWSPDGQILAFEQTGPGTGYDIWTFRLGDRNATPFLQTRFNEIGPRFSPDGRWLAYASDESGRFEVYVQPYPGPGGKWQISTEGGTEPIWVRNGELFYRNGDKVMVVQTITRPNFSASNPKALFEGRHATFQSIPDYDVSADGQRFLFLTPGDEGREEVNVVVNWTEELKRKAPAEKK